jgi:hypothetical protein
LVTSSAQTFEYLRRLPPLGELNVKRCPYATEPLLVGPGGKLVRRQCVMIAVENEPDGIDQGSVEIEEGCPEAEHPEEATSTALAFEGPKTTKPVSRTSTVLQSKPLVGSAPIRMASSGSVAFAILSTRTASPAV